MCTSGPTRALYNSPTCSGVSQRILELATAGIYLERSIFMNKHIHNMFVNQSDPKYQPKKCTITGDDGKTIITWWFVENVPVEAAGQLEAYNKHRHRCRDVDLIDEKDFVMVQQWCRAWMQLQTWRLTVWDEGIYHKELEASRARYFENKIAKQMGELERLGHTQRPSCEHDLRHESPRSRSTYLGPERTSSSLYPERSFRKDATTALCLKCGDTGHMACECHASKTVKGAHQDIL
ncbi:hypothetical protein B0H17DRAFT_1154308 [Mycena rosella]|uniref:CCHC-type domain-containing protein n=1 Tax=Mycena rosella TaxID=1033263 RepID=A0AAD7F6L3_MYCRO|nr:hypothetical protein B0H17DRAFT_1154308 [Mycena rosella]